MLTNALKPFAVVAFILTLLIVILAGIGIGAVALIESESSLFAGCDVGILNIDCSGTNVFLEMLAAVSSFGFLVVLIGMIVLAGAYETMVEGSVAGFLIFGLPILIFSVLAIWGLVISIRYFFTRRTV